MAIEHLKGADLRTAMREPPPMPLEKRLLVIIQVLAGLGHAHRAGIVHHDVHPATIFISDDGNVKLIDFGAARLNGISISGTGTVVDFVDYVSPEKMQGVRVDHRSDLFSVGSLLYELLAGRPPFHADNPHAIMNKISDGEINFDLIPASEPYLSLVPVLRKALHKDLLQRYQRAYDFAVDIVPVYAALAAVDHGNNEWIARLARVPE